MNADAVSTYSELSNLSEAYMLLIAKNNQRIPEITTIEWWPQTAREIINTETKQSKIRYLLDPNSAFTRLSGSSLDISQMQREVKSINKLASIANDKSSCNTAINKQTMTSTRMAKGNDFLILLIGFHWTIR